MTRYPYGTNPKWQPPPHTVRRTLHRLELWLAYHAHYNLATKVRRVRIRVGRLSCASREELKR